MNYFAHALPFLDGDPYFVAGTAVPDWLNVANRRVRVRSRRAAPFTEHDDPRIAELARGIVQHHADDDWFHNTRAFTELTFELTVLVRDALPADESFRPSFLGHILVEILLDGRLVERTPEKLAAYYDVLQRVEPDLVQRAVNDMAPRGTDRLAGLVVMFCQSRFLFDYSDDGRLWLRLNQVMRRVGLPTLPESFCDALPEARRRVDERWRELIEPPADERACVADCRWEGERP